MHLHVVTPADRIARNGRRTFLTSLLVIYAMAMGLVIMQLTCIKRRSWLAVEDAIVGWPRQLDYTPAGLVLTACARGPAPQVRRPWHELHLDLQAGSQSIWQEATGMVREPRAPSCHRHGLQCMQMVACCACTWQCAAAHLGQAATISRRRGMSLEEMPSCLSRLARLKTVSVTSNRSRTMTVAAGALNGPALLKWGRPAS